MINDAIRQIRDTVNRGVFLHNIERHGFQWNMVSASLDILGDTQLAIEAYQERQGKAGGDVSHAYLEAYGLFQAMFLQQDALTNLAEGLNLSRVRVYKNPDSAYVRNLRTKYFGHPIPRHHDFLFILTTVQPLKGSLILGVISENAGHYQARPAFGCAVEVVDDERNMGVAQIEATLPALEVGQSHSFGYHIDYTGDKPQPPLTAGKYPANVKQLVVKVRFHPDRQPAVVWFFERVPSVIRAPGGFRAENVLNPFPDGSYSYTFNNVTPADASGLAWRWPTPRPAS